MAAAAAARLLHRRLISPIVFTTRQPHTYTPKGFGLASRKREIQTKTDAKDEVKLEDQDSAKTPQQLTTSFSGSNGSGGVSYRALSSLKTSTRHDLAMIFTCRVCETRSVRTVCEESYERGVVVVRCGGCNNSHLIADHLGLFGAPGSVEDFLAARGEEVKKGSVDTFNLTPEDLAGSNGSSKR